MYTVSEAYLEKIMSRSVQTNWYGSIRSTIGTVYPFSLSTLVAGSGKVTRQICASEDLEIGSTCAAELDMSLYLENVNRYELYKGTVSLFFQVRLDDDNWETVPIGKFTIEEPPERSLSIVTIHAYDAMLKFNRDFETSLTGSPYSLLAYACQACGVELGMSQEEITNLPNGGINTFTYDDVVIYTYRDLVGFIAAYLCCYAYIGVDGKLYLQQYSMTPIREISENWRYDYKPKDYEAYYTALSAFFAAAQKTETVTAGSGGLTYAMGTNPLLQFAADDLRQTALTNIITALSAFSYTPFTAKVPCDPALTVGDVLNFTGNHAVDGKLSAITKQVITINGSMELSCAGSDPNLNVLTVVEKQIHSAQYSGDKDGMFYYDYANAEAITVHDGEYAQIIHFDYVTTKETHIDFHGEIKCAVETKETYDDATNCYTETDGIIRVTYRAGGVDITEYYPVDTFFDGVHLLNLMYAWRATADLTSSFDVLIKCEGCTVQIQRGAARGYIAGAGIVGETTWDGVVRVFQDFSRLDFGSLIRKDFESAAACQVINPVTPTAIEQVRRRNFYTTAFKRFTDSAVNASGLHRFSVAYNANEMSYSNIRITGNLWVVDNQAALGIVTTPDCTVNQIIQITSEHSGDDVAYIVSFDSGASWWMYADGWVAPDYSYDLYGMFEDEMRSITPAQWAEKLNGTIMVRAVLTENASLTDIQIFTEVYQ